MTCITNSNQIKYSKKVKTYLNELDVFSWKIEWNRENSLCSGSATLS